MLFNTLAVAALAALLSIVDARNTMRDTNSSSSCSSLPYVPGYSFYKGHDISSVLQEERRGVVYKDSARGFAVRPLEDILGDGGMNAVRLRMWVNPPQGNYSLNYTVALASRLYQKGYSIYLDYHFSDTWADPTKQWQPEAWPKDIQGLSSTLRSYVKETLLAFKQAGVELAIVSLGNEILHGMLWPLGRADPDIANREDRIANFTGFATLIEASRRGVDDAISAGLAKPEIMLHTAFAWNYTLQTHFYETLLATNKLKSTDFDSFGLSFYPYNGTNSKWSNLRRTMFQLAHKYNKPIHVAETNYPVSCSKNHDTTDRLALGVGPESQIAFMKRVINMVKSVPRGLGRGVWTWESSWMDGPNLGSTCDDMLLFERDVSKPGVLEGYSRTSVDLYLE